LFKDLIRIFFPKSKIRYFAFYIVYIWKNVVLLLLLLTSYVPTIVKKKDHTTMRRIQMSPLIWVPFSGKILFSIDYSMGAGDGVGGGGRSTRFSPLELVLTNCR
jgi:hypothetical protein